MLEYRQTIQLPPECNNCQELDCGECPVAGKRWELTAKCRLELQRKLKLKAIERLNREITEIDKQLSELIS